MNGTRTKRRWPARIASIVAVMLLGPFAMMVFGGLDLDTHWSEATESHGGLAPDPTEETAAIVQVYGARAYNWRGAFGIHTWIATKRRGEPYYWVHHVIGWNLYRGQSTVTSRRIIEPDFAWFNSPPELLLDRRGSGVELLIDRIEKAVSVYPYPHEYRVWPGPNSNSFTAFVAREVPDLGLDLPPTAIGKDYLVGGKVLDRMPSGTGWQVSLLGLLGIGIAWQEGLELNVLGLSAGIDFNDLALRLPGLGRVETLAGSIDR